MTLRSEGICYQRVAACWSAFSTSSTRVGGTHTPIRVPSPSSREEEEEEEEESVRSERVTRATLIAYFHLLPALKRS